MIGSVPDGWRVEKLGDISTIQAGGTPSRSKPGYWNGDIPWIKISDVKNKYTKNATEFITEEGLNNSSAKLFQVDTILYTIFATLGEVSILKFEATTNQAISGIVVKDKNVNLYYLYNYLKSIKQKVINQGRGVAQNNINLGMLKNIDIPLPPLPQQEKIVKVLDISSSLIEKQKELIEKYDLFLKSKFIEMFGDPISNPMGWEVEKLKNSIVDVKNGLTRRGTKNSGDIVLKLKDIRANYVNFINLNRIELDEKEKEKFIAEKNDLLFIRVNGNPEYVGRCAAFHGYAEPVYFNDHIMRIKLNTQRYNSVFLGYIVNSQYGKKQIVKYRKTSAGQHTISQDGLERLSFYLPPIDLQNKFASIVEKTEQIKKQESKKLEHLQTLHNSLMGKAFKGEIA